MIKLEISAEQYNLSGELKGRILERFGGLDEYMNTLHRGRVAVSWDGDDSKQTKVSAQVWGPGHEFEASDIEWDADTAITKAHHKLETQIRREHKKELDKRNHR
ncbi:HPF/RaiA family ribosome-associated protein [Microbulbifer hainanensis]|uniref:HPF/RaiA family ribosome-associated protein n=1 Tax=Microbulbifer hainanensis TaxID=2735675 RepID=UPI0018681CF9|nr:HPF/RaiA family ribosome-associated protein [Microbulbifer hainanensis]